MYPNYVPAFFGYVDGKHRVPVRAVLLTYSVVTFLALLNLNSANFVALGAITSLSSLVIYFSYAIVLAVSSKAGTHSRIKIARAPPKTPNDVPADVLDPRPVRYIAHPPRRCGFPVYGIDLIYNTLHPILPQIKHGDPHALVGQQLGRLPAHPRRRARTIALLPRSERNSLVRRPAGGCTLVRCDLRASSFWSALFCAG
ncbi:hypothetical protein DL771_005919 [Monosporascus sp. 5C6A]|nr:hypothetical protein DL771_005919 [Monosporascus sp. 5C6A]